MHGMVVDKRVEVNVNANSSGLLKNKSNSFSKRYSDGY